MGGFSSPFERRLGGRSEGRTPTQTGLFSAVVPAYNAGACLARCLDSILAQTYLPIEIIVVDDGSTDTTRDVAATYGTKIRYVHQTNLGETAARNTGIAMAQGEFVAFLDHDDYWKPEFAAACVSFLRLNLDAKAVSVASEHVSAFSGRHLMPAGMAHPPAGWTAPFVIGRFFDFWAEHRHVCCGAVTMRHELLDEAGGQRDDLVLSGDLEYWAYLATFGKWGFIPAVHLAVDGAAAARSGELYQKYRQRYQRCPTVEDWQSRVLPRLEPDELPGFARVRGHVATWFVFARIFVGDDEEALRTARAYKESLEGRFGRLWRMGQIGGSLTWKAMCRIVRLRVRYQYRTKSASEP